MQAKYEPTNDGRYLIFLEKEGKPREDFTVMETALSAQIYTHGFNAALWRFRGKMGLDLSEMAGS